MVDDPSSDLLSSFFCGKGEGVIATPGQAMFFFFGCLLSKGSTYDGGEASPLEEKEKECVAKMSAPYCSFALE